jgi:uncharacterized membrane protein YfcA
MLQKESVLLNVAAVVGVSAGCATPLGVMLSRRLGDKLLARVFSLGLITLSPVAALKPYLVNEKSSTARVAARETKSEETDDATRAVRTRIELLIGMPTHAGLYFGAVGAAIGFSSALTGFGAGVLLTTALSVASDNVLYAGHRFEQKTAIATSLLALTLPNAVQSLSHWRMRSMRVPVAIGLACGAVVGGPLGAVVAHRIPDSYLRVGFGAFLFATGVRAWR